MAAEELDFQDSWDDLRKTSTRRKTVRPKIIQVAWEPPAQGPLLSWLTGVQEGREALLAVPGPTPTHRREVYNQLTGFRSATIQDWLRLGPVPYLISQVLSPGCMPHTFLQALTCEELVIADPLQDLVDRGFRFTEVFKALWEAFFLRKEGRTSEYEELLSSLFRWLVGAGLDTTDTDILRKSHITRAISTPRERLDLLFFLVALARQNSALDHQIVVFDGIEQAVRQGKGLERKQALRDLLLVIDTAERWNRSMESATGLVMGYDPERGTLSNIRRYNSKLATKLQAASV